METNSETIKTVQVNLQGIKILVVEDNKFNQLIARSLLEKWLATVHIAENGQKAVIMILEDFYDAKRTSENLAWTYETDFEFLKGDDISQIVVGGKRCYDYLVRLLIAGIDKSKIFCCVNETDTVSLLKPQLFNKLIIMYDLFNVKSLDAIKSQLGSALERN